MYKKFTFFSFCLLLYAGFTQESSKLLSQMMKENLGEWTTEMRKCVKGLERQIGGLENKGEPVEYDNLIKNLWKFYDLVKQKTKIRTAESDDQNEQKWIKLAQEYSIKFRDSQMIYYYDKNIQLNYAFKNRIMINYSEIKHDPKEIMEKIADLIRGFGADLNTFLAQINLLSLEEEFEQYMEKGDKLVRAEEWAKIVKNLEKLMENEKIDRQMVGKLKNEYEQNEIYTEYRKNVEEMVGKMEKEVQKIRKEIDENRQEIYMTEWSFEEAETRINEVKNGKTQREMSNLQGILEMLILDSKLDILSKEFETKMEKIILKNENGTPIYDWVAFLSLCESFQIGYEQIEQLIGKLSSKNDLNAIQMEMDGIRKMAQKAVPIKHLLIEKLSVLGAETRADLDKIYTDLFTQKYDKVTDQFDQMKRFYGRAIEFCDKFAKLYHEFGILRGYISPIATGADLREEFDELLEYKISIGHANWSARDNYAELKAMVEALEEMKKRVEESFSMP